MQARNLSLRAPSASVKLCGMKNALCLSALSLMLISCVGTKNFSVYTYPEGADISINGEPIGKSPVTTEINQDKALGIMARKPGYMIASETITPQTSKFLAFIWTKDDPKAQYIEEDSVHINLQKIQTTQSYTPSVMPPYTGGGGSTSAALPEVPALRPMPKLD